MREPRDSQTRDHMRDHIHERLTARYRLLVCALACVAWSNVPAQSPLAGPSPVWEVYAIRYGALPAFRVSSLIAGADTSRRIDAALMVWLLKGPDGRNVLVDAGFQRADLIARWKPIDYMRPDSAVARTGIRASDITDVIISHIHWDHFDGATLFPKAKIWIQWEEVDHHIDSLGGVRNRAIDAPDAAMLSQLRADGRLLYVDGDAKEIIPGITVYTGGKHTYQSQYAGVRTAEGTVVIASDNMYLYENLDDHVPIFQTLDAASNLRAQERMTGIASTRRLIIPGHDPLVFQRFTMMWPGVVRIR